MALAQLPSDAFTISFGLYGAEQDEGLVRVADLAKCLNRLEECLLATERCIRNQKPKLSYLVNGLSKGSALCSIEARMPSKGSDYRKDVVLTTRRTIRSLQSGDANIDPRLDRNALQKYRRLGDIIGSRYSGSHTPRIVVEKIELTSQFGATLDEILSPKDVSYGSVSGTLEKIDVHQKNQFSIYPAISGHQVVCSFKDDLLEQVKNAVKKNVTVYGDAHYAAGALFPVRIEVRELEVHTLSAETKSLDQLIGILSSMPGESASLIRKQRDDWAD